MIYTNTQICLTVSNFQNIKGALSFPLIHNTFLYGQPGTNKSTVHKCIQLISDNCFSFPLIKNFNALGPQANINSVLYDCNKPLSFNFQFYSSIGEISFAYQINKLDNSPHGHVTGFQITYKNTPVFFQSNKNASIFPAGLLLLLKSAQDFISTEKIKGLDAESSSLNTDLLQPLTELFDTTISNFEWVSSGLTQIKPSPCKTRVHESHPNHFMPDFFQMFPNDVNFDLAEFGGKFVHNAYYALPSFFNFNSFKSKKCDTHFSGLILHSDQKSNFYFNHLLKQPRKVQDLLDELHLPCVEKIPVVDQMGGVIGNQLMVMNSQKKLIPITQESSKNQQAILCVYDLMNSLEDIDFRNSTKQPVFVFLSNVDHVFEPWQFQKVLLYLNSHHPEVICVADSSSEAHLQAFLSIVKHKNKSLAYKSWILSTSMNQGEVDVKRTTFYNSGDPEDFFPSNLKTYSHWKLALTEWIGFNN